jgi:hypothetical protein
VGTIWPSGEHNVFLGLYWSMKGNEGATVVFEWDTEILLTVIKNFKFKIESSAPFSPISPAAQKGKFYFIPKFTCLNVASVEVTFTVKCT